MNVDPMNNNKSLPIEHALPGQNTSVGNGQQHINIIVGRSNTENVTNNINKKKKPSENRDEIRWTEDNTALSVCAFVIFTSIVMTIGVVIVCVTSPKQPDVVCQLTFERSAERAIGYDSHPRYIVADDFNSDDELDIAVANTDADSIGILLGYGNGYFTDQITISIGLRSRPYSLAVGDFNNDTRLDIAVANYGINSIGVLLGDGNGNFSSQIITSLGSSHPMALAVGDFNKDNYLDTAVVSYGTFTIAILLGSNDGSFRVEATYNMGYDSNPYSLIVIDLNKDNRLDIGITNYGTSNLAILLANENGSFVIYEYSTGTGSHPCSITVGDFNSDNTLDIAVANSATSNVGIFLGQGDGAFTNMMIHYTGPNSRPQFIVSITFTNDTKLDIVIVDSGNNNLLVLEGDGTGNFAILTTHSTGYNSNPSSIAIGDFDNDNKSDIAITNKDVNNILVLTAYASYPITNLTTYRTGISSEPIFVAIGDFNNDNFSDIVVVKSGDDNIGIFINRGNGTFEDQTTITTIDGSKPYSAAVHDVNNDYQLDIIIVMSEISMVGILLGHGNGTFSYGELYPTGENAYPASITVGDLNNDSNADIIVANYNAANVGVFIGYGDGNFTGITTYLDEIDFFPGSVQVGDINNDKTLDIVASDFNQGGIAILLNYGNGSFRSPLLISTDDDLVNSLAIGDLNNDHQLDIVYASPSFSNVGILLGCGNGTFGNIIRYSTGQGSLLWSVTLGYFNNDTLLDIAVSNLFSSTIDIFFGVGNGSFLTRKTFSTGVGSSPSSIACSDFNNDNKQDIVVSNRIAENIGVFLIHYTADFAYGTPYFTGSGPHPYSVAIGDFNNDNQSDIVVANSGNDNIELLLGYNAGTFMNKVTYSTGAGSFPQFVSVADFNRDSQLDIVVANNRNGNINVFLGNNNGTFDEPSIYLTGSNSFPISIAVGDFNKDNWTDIVVANSGTNNIGVFLGLNYATFTNETLSIRVPFSVPIYVTTGDFNNDHLWDVVVADAVASSIHVYLGYGNGSFKEQISSPTGTYSPTSIAVGDLNKDNQLDVVVTISDGNAIGIFISYGNGSFQPQTTYFTGDSSNPLSIAIGDFNKDKIPDIVVGNHDSDNIGIFIGNGNGTFQEQISYSMPYQSFPRWVAIDDLNNDNILDIVVANSGQNNVGLFFGYGDATFGDMMELFTGYYSGPFSVTTGDVNNDTHMDIAVANRNTQNVGIFLGYGNGTFSSQLRYSTGSQSDLTSIAITDINNDTKLDIVVSDWGNGNANIGILYGFGDGNFPALKTYATGLNSNPLSIVICDFNNDSRLDLAASYFSKASIGIMLWHKSEPFATPTLFGTGNESYPKSVAVGDFNNNNHLDIVVANSGTNNIGIFLGNGDGTFAVQQIYLTGDNSAPVSIGVGDFNNDSFLDIAVVNSKTNTLAIFRGYENGIVSLLKTYSTGISSAPSSIAVKDLNKDNYLDIVVSNYGINNVLVYFGLSDGTFSKSDLYYLEYDANPQSIAIGDINNDSLLDIVVANSGTDYVEILLQTC